MSPAATVVLMAARLGIDVGGTALVLITEIDAGQERSVIILRLLVDSGNTW
jgi:hypothetical protein